MVRHRGPPGRTDLPIRRLGPHSGPRSRDGPGRTGFGPNVWSEEHVSQEAHGSIGWRRAETFGSTTDSPVDQHPGAGRARTPRSRRRDPGRADLETARGYFVPVNAGNRGDGAKAAGEGNAS
jgi:hypothetical protein